MRLGNFPQGDYRFLSGFSFRRPSDPLEYLFAALPSSSDGSSNDQTKLTLLGVDSNSNLVFQKQEAIPGADFRFDTHPKLFLEDSDQSLLLFKRNAASSNRIARIELDFNPSNPNLIASVDSLNLNTLADPDILAVLKMGRNTILVFSPFGIHAYITNPSPLLSPLDPFGTDAENQLTNH